MSRARAAARLLSICGLTLEALGRARLELDRLAPRLRRRRQADGLQRIARDLCRSHGFDVRVSGLLPAGPAVLVSNHLSYVDPIALACLWPCLPIAKGEIGSWPLLGAGARSLGVIFVKRGDALSGAVAIRRAMRALADGVPVLGFPEGTTSRGSDVLPFRRGLFGLARLANVPVVPIAVEYEDPRLAWVGDAWFLPHYLETAARARTTVHVRIGHAIPSHSVRCAEDLAQLARSHIGRLLRRPPLTSLVSEDRHESASRRALSPSRTDSVLSAALR